jgi:uncharacterized membrane protein
MDARTKAIISHLTFVGWIVALLINNDNREEFTSFYLRQTLGIHLLSMAVSWVPVVGWIIGMIIFAFWILSFVYSIQGQMKIIPFGEYFQDWFRAL